eukprot:scaffold206786_cov19-Tisochrysis_lutea.AAC.3
MVCDVLCSRERLWRTSGRCTINMCSGRCMLFDPAHTHRQQCTAGRNGSDCQDWVERHQDDSLVDPRIGNELSLPYRYR